MAIATDTFDATGTRPGWTTVRSTAYVVTGYSGGVGSIPSQPSGTAANASARRDVDLGGVDQFCDCTVTALPGDSDRTLFLFTRMGTGSSPAFYGLAVNRNLGTLSLLRYSNPTTASPLVSGLAVTIPANGFTLQFQAQGTGSAVTLRALFNGSVVATTDDTNSARLLTGNYAGFGTYRSGANGATTPTPTMLIDNWRGGLLSDIAPAGPELGRGLLAA